MYRQPMVLSHKSGDEELLLYVGRSQNKLTVKFEKFSSFFSAIPVEMPARLWEASSQNVHVVETLRIRRTQHR